MSPTEELAKHIGLLVDAFIREHGPTSGDKRQIYDDLYGPLQTQRDLIKQERDERERLVQEDEKRLAKKRERIDHAYNERKAFIHFIECLIGKKPTGKKPKNVDSTHTDKDGGYMTKEGDRYPTAPPSPQGDQFSQANEHLSSTKKGVSSKRKRRASSSGVQDQPHSGVKKARGRSHSPGREGKKEVNYPDLRPSNGPATDHETYRSQPVTPTSKENIFVAEPIFPARREVSSSKEDSPSLTKNVPRAKRNSRESRVAIGRPPRRSTRQMEKVHYPK